MSNKKDNEKRDEPLNDKDFFDENGVPNRLDEIIHDRPLTEKEKKGIKDSDTALDQPIHDHHIDLNPDPMPPKNVG